MWGRISRKAERRGQGEHHDELLRGLAGPVIEIGAGNGINFMHYPDFVQQVVAVEAEPQPRERAEKAAGRAPVPVEVCETRLGELPFEDASFDAGVACLVLCTVPDQQARRPSSAASSGRAASRRGEAWLAGQAPTLAHRSPQPPRPGALVISQRPPLRSSASSSRPAVSPSTVTSAVRPRSATSRTR